MRTLVRLGLIVLAGALLVAGLIYYRVGGADVRWEQFRAWLSGKAGEVSGGADLGDLLAPYETIVGQLKQEAADAEKQFAALREKAKGVTDAALQKLTDEEQQRVAVLKQKVAAAADELENLERQAREAGDATRDDLRSRVAAALDRRRVLADAGREARQKATATVEQEVRRRTLLSNALDPSEKAVFRGFPDTWSFDEKWDAAVRHQLELRGTAPSRIPESMDRRRSEALRDLGRAP